MLLILFTDSVAKGFISIFFFSLALLAVPYPRAGFVSVLKDSCIKLRGKHYSYVESIIM